MRMSRRSCSHTPCRYLPVLGMASSRMEGLSFQQTFFFPLFLFFLRFSVVKLICLFLRSQKEIKEGRHLLFGDVCLFVRPLCFCLRGILLHSRPHCPSLTRPDHCWHWPLQWGCSSRCLSGQRIWRLSHRCQEGKPSFHPA